MTEEKAGTAAADTVDAKTGEGQEADPKSLNEWIEQRTKLKARIRELEPLAEKGKKLEDDGKTEAQRLAEELATLRPKAERADALEAEVTAVLDAELAEASDDVKALVRGNTPEERLAHVREMRKAGILGEKKGVAAVGARIGGATTNPKSIKEEDWRKKTPAEKMKLTLAGVRVV